MRTSFNFRFLLPFLAIGCLLAGTAHVAAKEPSVQVIVLSPDGSRLYAANGATGSTDVIDTASLQVIGTIPGLAPYSGMAISPDGTRLYGESNSGLIAIDTRTLKEVGRLALPRGASNLGVAPDGGRVYAAGYDGDLVVVDAIRYQRVGQVRVGGQLTGMAVSPDGKRVYVSSVTDDNGRNLPETPHFLAVIDTDRLQVIAEIPVGRSPYGVGLSPDGTRAYVANTDGPPAVIDTVALARIGWLQMGSTFQMAVSPDGKRLYASSTTCRCVSVVDTERLERIALPLLSHMAQFLAVSPDGRRVYVSQYDTLSIAVLDTATNEFAGKITLTSTAAQGSH
jgi:YVTN family beta-propeller protein